MQHHLLVEFAAHRYRHHLQAALEMAVCRYSSMAQPITGR
jgi:hypothetical protein